ncbi:MAG: hypothetical protein ACD_25C00265G0003 [uncultured bacterium]|uniref:Uncharacterized protein n=2 Tax=Katanobacteria TaxID=422282 RepID=A0A0G1HN98_UNCKA|nr:MAG: hypothetical protein ACD_25C00265G0003 [uncultured bacterium]KKT12339.1 MAG: hypothetical protein UV89_C0001G0017 [candidate division WWE3 bacterium GW2011_GWB2_43_22]
MFSKLLIKLIDQAIIPAVVLVSTRIVSMALLAMYFEVPFELTNKGFIFEGKEQYIQINSYSMLIMTAVLAVSLAFFLLKAHVFHDTHITPKLTATLFSLRMQGLVQSSLDLYTKGAIWISYAYLMTILTGALALYSYIYSFVFYTTLAVAAVSSILFVSDIENEVKTSKDDGLDHNVTFLEVGTDQL